jgi:hypothetical protein
MRDGGVLCAARIEEQVPIAWLNAKRLAIRHLESSRWLLILRSLKRHLGHDDRMR